FFASSSSRLIVSMFFSGLLWGGAKKGAARGGPLWLCGQSVMTGLRVVADDVEVAGHGIRVALELDVVDALGVELVVEVQRAGRVRERDDHVLAAIGQGQRRRVQSQLLRGREQVLT